MERKTRFSFAFPSLIRIFAPMKQIVYTVILSLTISSVIVSCGQHRYPPLLLAADSLCNVKPDSAVSLLLKLRPQMRQEGKAARMYYDLLRIKAADKTDRLNPSADSILPLVAYYEGRGDKRLLPTAYYYAGRTYYELHDAPQALEYFQKAAERSGDDLALKCRIYSNIGYLFMYQGLYDEAYQSFSKVSNYSEQINDTIGMIYGLRDKTIALEAQGKHDESLKSIRQSYGLARSHGSIRMIKSVELYLANQFKHIGCYDSALYYARKAQMSMLPSERSSVFSTLASIYKKTQQEDSMICYSMKMLEVGNAYAKDSAYKYLARVYLQRGDLRKGYEFLSQFFAEDDLLRSKTTTEATARVSAIYSYQQREKQNQELEKKNQRREKIIFFSAIFTAFLLFVFVQIVIYYRKKQRELIRRHQYVELLKDKSLMKTQRQIDENLEKIALLEQKISHMDMERKDRIKELEREKERLVSRNYIAEIGLKERGKSEEAVMNSPIYHVFSESYISSSARTPSEADWKDLEYLIDSEYDGFTRKLRSLCPLSKQEYRISLLIKAGFRPTYISKLLNTSKNNVSTIRSRAYNRYFGKKGSAEKWDEFIKSL